MQISRTMNDNAPSSWAQFSPLRLPVWPGLSKGKETADLTEMACAMEAASEVSWKTGSKLGEKTILDAVYPAVEVLKDSARPERDRIPAAAEAAKAGSESTRQMRSVHGRAAYYGDKSIGVLDGGSVAGSLLFQAIALWQSDAAASVSAGEIC
jgi:dihydroxyacetone kinase